MRTAGSETIFGNCKPFKNDEKYFLIHFVFLTSLNVCPRFFDYVEKRFDKRADH